MFGTSELFDDPVDGIHGLVGRLAGEDRSGWSGAARSERVLGLMEAAERLQAELLRAVGEWDRVAAWGEDGALSPVAWLAYRTPATKGTAARLVRSARLVRRDERVAAAVAEGRISSAHVEVIADAIRRREDVYEEHGAVLVELAEQVVPQDFATVARSWRNLADDVIATDDAHAEHLHRSLVFSGSSERPRAEFEGDRDGFAKFVKAVERFMTFDPPDDPSPARTVAQRRADALVEMCDEILARGDRAGHSIHQMDSMIDLATLSGGQLADLAGVRCELTHAGSVPRVILERLGCDSAAGRIVMNGPSEVLDVGRRTRVVSAAQRRALEHRDRGCVFPGCDRPPTWTDAHHLVHWSRGGPTDLDNLVLLCRRHHVLCHEGRWTLERSPDGTVTAGRPPRRPKPPPPREPPPPRDPTPPTPPTEGRARAPGMTLAA